MKTILLLASILVLAGCGDPIATMTKLSEVELSDQPTAREAAPAPEETDETTGFLARILRQPLVSPTEAEQADTGPLPYGKLGRACGLARPALGKEIAAYPEKRPVYRLYDTTPNAVSPRTFYLTGFKDGCPRAFTAALAIFGGAEMHEQLRYGLPAAVQPYSATDKAYEGVKSSVCRVAASKPCGSRLGTLQRDTVFLSIYERYGDTSRWVNLLLHRGAIVAQDMKGS